MDEPTELESLRASVRGEQEYSQRVALQRDKLLVMLKRWQLWKKSESVDCALDHDTAKLIKSIEAEP